MSISSTNQFYVYVYLDPRKPEKYKYGEFEFDYEPFYIGKGEGKRLFEHLKPSRQKKESHTIKVRKIKKIIKETNQKPIIIKFKENMFEQDALNFETKMIKTIGRIDLETGPLTNLTDGGEQPSNISEESKKKNSEKHKGKLNPMFGVVSPNKGKFGNLNPNFGKKHSEESKKIMSQKNKGKIISEEQRIQISKSLKEYYKNKTQKEINI